MENKEMTLEEKLILILKDNIDKYRLTQDTFGSNFLEIYSNGEVHNFRITTTTYGSATTQKSTVSIRLSFLSFSVELTDEEIVKEITALIKEKNETQETQKKERDTSILNSLVNNIISEQQVEPEVPLGEVMDKLDTLINILLTQNKEFEECPSITFLVNGNRCELGCEKLSGSEVYSMTNVNASKYDLWREIKNSDSEYIKNDDTFYTVKEGDNFYTSYKKIN